MFVDTEPRHNRDSRVPERLDAARTRLTYRLEDLAERPVHLVRRDAVAGELVNSVYSVAEPAKLFQIRQIEVEAIFVSGNSVAPASFGAEADALFELVTNTERPTFGFCGGHQLIARALGVDSVPVVDGENTPATESGYLPVETTADHPLTLAIGNAAVFRQHHSWQVPTAPPGFVNLASTALSEVQMLVNEDRHMVTTQFHPEYWTSEHPAGAALIRAFLEWSGVISPGPAGA